MIGDYEGEGVSKILKESVKLNWNFQGGRGGGGVQQKKIRGGGGRRGVWIFSGTTQCGTLKQLHSLLCRFF